LKHFVEVIRVQSLHDRLIGKFNGDTFYLREVLAGCSVQTSKLERIMKGAW